MSSRLDLDDKHVTEDKSSEPEEYSWPSTTEEVQTEESERSNEAVQDKEAQLDARSTTTTESAIPPPPDGGLHAWLKVFGGFMIYINIWLAFRDVLQIPDDPFADDGQGLYTNIRRLPNILQKHAPLILQSIRYIMDRHRTSLAPHCNRRHVWPTL